MQLLMMRRSAQPAPVCKPVHSTLAETRPRTPYYQMHTPQRSALRPCPAPTPAPVDPDLPRDIASRFGRRVRELRQARSMTQVEVSVHFGIDRTFISDVERGRKAVCLPTMEVFALGFGLSLSDLLRGL